MNGDEIVKYVAEATHVSFVQLEREFPQYFGGTQCISLTGLDTIILWTGFTEEGSALFLNLVNSKRLYFHPTTTLFGGMPAVYMIDGKLLSRSPSPKQIYFRDCLRVSINVTSKPADQNTMRCFIQSGKWQ